MSRTSAGMAWGHAAREVEILRHLPADIPLVIKTVAPEWFFREEIARSFEYVSAQFDVGCVQHNSLDIDIPATLRAWNEVNTHNQATRESERNDLWQRGARVVVSDVASFPLTVAEHMGIPGVCVVNFTWADIYAAFVDAEPAFTSIVTQLQKEYAQATLALDTALALPMPYFERKEKVGLVARPGSSKRESLLEFLGPVASGKRIALIYLGNWGYDIPYERLEQFHNWHFVSLAAPPVPVQNWTVAPRHLLAHPDLVASVDLVISKTGYGLVGECLSSGTPLLYPPRPVFAEYAAIAATLKDWPGSLPLSDLAFLDVNWKPLLDAVPAYGTLKPLPSPGGPQAASRIAQLYTT